MAPSAVVAERPVMGAASGAGVLRGVPVEDWGTDRWTGGSPVAPLGAEPGRGTDRRTGVPVAGSAPGAGVARLPGGVGPGRVVARVAAVGPG
ncbi:hypothetical protein [Streptomyces sp. NPDC058812]|uniref:hypothetical protein n=1 Tax=unclassified Streptomyces TaxID=2593676 RepID=UPI00368C0F03